MVDYRRKRLVKLGSYATGNQQNVK